MRCFPKKAEILLLSWSTLYIVISKSLYSVLILVCLFWFATILPKYMCKTNFFVQIWERSKFGNIASFVEQPKYSLFKMYCVLILSFLFSYTVFHSKLPRKSYIALRCYVLCEGSSDIASFVEHSVYSKFKMYNIQILVFYWWFRTIHPKCLW